MKLIKGIALVSAASLLAACGSDSDDEGEAPINYPSTYEFQSKINAGESSVKFTGQGARQLLISEMKGATGNSEITGAELLAIYNQGVTYLNGRDIYSVDGVGTTIVPVSAPNGFELVQADYGDVVLDAGTKHLKEKTAGCDNKLSADQFIGWTLTGALQDCGQDQEVALDKNDAPYSLMLEWITAAADGKVDTTLGLDYSQLFQKFLLGAVAFSQTAEDYLAADHEKSSKGLKASNAVDPDDQDPDSYTSLEHAWDEGFGYFGATLDYLSIADETIADQGIKHSDVSGEYKIDLLRGEYNFGLAQYASKHDYMTRLDAQPTNLSNDIMVAFLEGRQLIVDNHGTTPVVGDALHTRLSGIASRAVKGLEKVIAISVVKYINSTIAQVTAYPTSDENNSPAKLAKYFSELKGFALGLQFNPAPTLSFADQVTLHSKIGQAPVLSITAGKAEYLTALEEARTLVVEAYGFDASAAEAWK